MAVGDQACVRLEPLLPSSQGKRGGRWRDHRQVIEAIAWRYRTGPSWRDLPESFGPWQTAWQRLDRWSRDGTWERLVQLVQGEADAAAELDWVVSVDSMNVRAHQHAAGARRVDAEPAEPAQDVEETGPDRLTGGSVD